LNWHAANAYADWAFKRLPTEEEWVKAASVTDEHCSRPSEFLEWTASPWPKDPDYRVLRGFPASGKEDRSIAPPYLRILGVGFRCAMTAD
jgi:hypothetical protein